MYRIGRLVSAIRYERITHFCHKPPIVPGASLVYQSFHDQGDHVTRPYELWYWKVYTLTQSRVCVVEFDPPTIPYIEHILRREFNVWAYARWLIENYFKYGDPTTRYDVASILTVYLKISCSLIYYSHVHHHITCGATDRRSGAQAQWVPWSWNDSTGDGMRHFTRPCETWHEKVYQLTKRVWFSFLQ